MKNNIFLSRIGISGIATLLLVATIEVTLADCNIGNVSSAGQAASLAAMQSICGQQQAAGTPTSLACTLAPGVGTNAVPLQQLSPQAAIQAESIAITSPYSFIRNVNKWLTDRNTAEQNFSGNVIKSGGPSGFDTLSFLGPIGISFSGGGGFGDHECSQGQTGYNIDTRQGNLILDYRFSQELVGGFAFNYVNTNRTLGFGSGTLNSDSYRFAPFLSYAPTPESYITLMGGYALVNFDSSRAVNPTGFTVANAQTKYDADEFFASLGGGYTYRQNHWSLRGYGRADYNHMRIGGLNEKGGVASDGFAYTSSVNGQNILSATSTLGSELSYAYSTSANYLPAVIIPKLRAEWVHEYENGSRQAQTTYRAFNPTSGQLFTSGQSFAVAGPVRNWANLGFGVQMEFKHGLVGFLNYDTLFIENGSNQTVTGGFRVNY